MSSADQNQPVGQPAQDVPASSDRQDAVMSVNDSRRRFVGKGLAVPAVLTVASSSVMGAVRCRSASAIASGHTSGLARHDPFGFPVCDGLSASSWSQLASSSTTGNRSTANASAMMAASGWPSAYPPDKKFSDVFSPTPGGVKNSDTLADVLAMSNQPAAQALIATLLNVASGKVDPRVLSGRTPQSIWRDMNSPQGFIPFTGAKPWSAAKVVTWLSSTWGAPLPSDFANWA